MDYRLTFSTLPGEADGGPLDLTRVAGVGETDLAELADGRLIDLVTAEAGWQGKGASGPGLTLVLHLVEEAGTDGASLLALGAAVATLVRKVRQRHPRRLAHTDVPLMTALALASADGLPALGGSRFNSCSSLTGGGAGVGTDERDVWVSWFTLSSDDLLGLFHGPSGLLLGHIIVPPGWSRQRGSLDQEDARRVFQQLNRADAPDPSPQPDPASEDTAAGS